MDDLADLVWQQAGVAKPHAAHSTHSTPLAQLAAHPRAPTPVDAARAASPRYPPLPPMGASPSPAPAVPMPMAHYTSAPMRPASAASATPAVAAARPNNDDPFGALVSFGSAAGGRNAQQASTAHMSLADQVKLKQQQQQQQTQPAYAITPMGASGRSTPASRPTVQPQAPTPSLGQFDVAFLDSLVGGSSSSSATPANGARIGGGSHPSSAANSARASPAPPLGLHPFAAPLSGSPAFAAPAPVAASSIAAADPWDLLLQGGTSSSSPATPQPVNAAPAPANDDLLLGDFFSPAPAAARASTPLAAPLAPTASPPTARRATHNPPTPAAASAAAAGIPPPPAPARRMSNPPGMALGASVAAESAAAAASTTTTQTTPSLRASTPPARAEPSFDAKLAKLVDMGFSADMAAEALRATNGNLEQALHLVFNETMAREQQQQQQQQSKVSSFLGKASSLLNKSKGIVQSKVGELKEQGGVLANMVNVVQARLQQPSSAGGDRTPDEDHWEREARANFYGQQPVPANGSPAPSPPAVRRTPPRPRSRTPPRTPPRGPSTGDLLGSLATTAPTAAPPVPPRPASAAGLPPRAVTPVAPPAAVAPPAPAPPKEKVRPPFPVCAGLMADQSAHAKAQGNDAYRLGQYHEAVTYYSDAISALPANHLALVALHNNRAAAELKTGEYKEAIADTLAAIAVVEYYGGLDRPSETITDGTNTVGWADVTKALLRQASALENVEKYAEAKEQFAAVLAREAGNKVASDGMARCQRALSPAAKQAADAAPAPPAAAATPAAAAAQEPASVVAMFDTLLTTNDASTPTTGGTAPETAPAVTQDEVDRSSRVRRLRAQERKAEAEAEAALAVKDEIDAQLAAWRKGKETNLRALLASLELVLWPELGWQKVELGQLITPAQCKVRYMKAIAKLHPDKLQTENVAHKMMATAVFAQLNEAWDAFRTQNNM